MSTESGIRSPGTGGTGGHELSDRCGGELSSALLEEQELLLTIESLLRAQSGYFYFLLENHVFSFFFDVCMCDPARMHTMVSVGDQRITLDTICIAMITG